MQKQPPVNEQIARHCRNKGAHSNNAAYELIRPAIARNSWYKWQTGKGSIGVNYLEKLCDKLGLGIVIVDLKTGLPAKGRTPIPD